jgi:hypothetical protein
MLGILVAGAFVVVGVAAAILAGGSNGGAPETALPLHPVAGTFKPNDVKLEACSEQTCFEQAYGNIAYRQGPRPALELFDRQYGDGSDPGCHRVAHAIGSAALSRYHGNVAKTFAAGSSSCWSGYYHGVLERALLQVKSYDATALGDVARGLCDDAEVRAVSWLAYQCLHGLGHGLMITTGYDLPRSLEACKRLAGDWDQNSCKGGAFMENIATSYGVASPWVKDDDPVYPCNWVEEEDKQTCYQLVTSRILRVVGVDWERVAQICSTVEQGWVSQCFQSYGRDVSGQTHRDPAQIVPLCAVARPYGGERDCVMFAAMDMTANFTGGTQAAQLCTTTPPDLRAPCFHAVGTIMGRFGTSPSEREADCRAISTVAADVDACVRGANGNTLPASIAR